jgi:hypothetical protein
VDGPIRIVTRGTVPFHCRAYGALSHNRISNVTGKSAEPMQQVDKKMPLYPSTVP